MVLWQPFTTAMSALPPLEVNLFREHHLWLSPIENLRRLSTPCPESLLCLEDAHIQALCNPSILDSTKVPTLYRVEKDRGLGTSLWDNQKGHLERASQAITVESLDQLRIMASSFWSPDVFLSTFLQLNNPKRYDPSSGKVQRKQPYLRVPLSIQP